LPASRKVFIIKVCRNAAMPVRSFL